MGIYDIHFAYGVWHITFALVIIQLHIIFERYFY